MKLLYALIWIGGTCAVCLGMLAAILKLVPMESLVYFTLLTLIILLLGVVFFMIFPVKKGSSPEECSRIETRLLLQFALPLLLSLVFISQIDLKHMMRVFLAILAVLLCVIYFNRKKTPHNMF